MSDNGATSERGFIGQLMSDLSNTPYRSYKKWVFQGGTSTPFILTYGDKKKNIKKGEICRQPAHIIDIMPTCMALGKLNIQNILSFRSAWYQSAPVPERTAYQTKNIILRTSEFLCYYRRKLETSQSRQEQPMGID